MKKKSKYHPVRAACYRRFNKALASGELIRQPCEICGNPNAQGHHENHAKPLDVIWWCQFHHSQHHGRQPKSDEMKRKTGDFHRGKIVSAETRLKQSLAHLGQPAHNKGKPGTNRGKQFSPDWCARIAEGQRRRWARWRAQKECEKSVLF